MESKCMKDGVILLDGCIVFRKSKNLTGNPDRHQKDRCSILRPDSIIRSARKYPVMASEEKREWRRKHRGHFLIPAGILIGLGIGLLTGYPAPGVLVGLGLGLLGSAFQRHDEAPASDTAVSASAPVHWGEPRWISVFIGIFIILVGLGLIWAPAMYWQYIIAIFLVLFGIWFIAGGYGRGR
jgi:hypothetical protein